MKKIPGIIALVLFLLLNINAFAVDADTLMQQANSLYQQGEYEKAINRYNEIVNRHYESPALFYNLGNAYYRFGNIGYAILNYEKALKLSPGNDDIQHNLKVANSKTVDKIENLPEFFIFEWWESLLALFALKGWTYIAYFFYILILISLGLYFFLKNPAYQKYSLYSGAVSVIILLLVTVILVVNINRELNYKNGIVVETVVNVKQSPDPKSNEAFVIHEGLKVKLEDQLDNWIKIRLQDGKVGWMTKDDLKVI